MDKSRTFRIAEKSLIRALLHIRVLAIREGQPGLEHVEALLRLRGVDLAEHHVPAKTPKAFKRGVLQSTVRRMLRGGPKTLAELEALIPGPERSVERALQHLRKKGGVVRETGAWKLG